MIFVDTNVFYNSLFDTKFSTSARGFIEANQELATSSSVVNELILVAIRNLCEERYGTRNHSSFRRFIAQKGYEPFKKDMSAILQFLEDSDICIVPTNENIDEWSIIMQKFRLLPYDALIISTCISNGIKEIATFDKDFKRVDILSVLDLNE
ncbi:MAG: PIN domain-containing protein [Methanotrichaceae archaeon]